MFGLNCALSTYVLCAANCVASSKPVESTVLAPNEVVALVLLLLDHDDASSLYTKQLPEPVAAQSSDPSFVIVKLRTAASSSGILNEVY